MILDFSLTNDFLMSLKQRCSHILLTGTTNARLVSICVFVYSDIVIIRRNTDTLAVQFLFKKKSKTDRCVVRIITKTVTLKIFIYTTGTCYCRLAYLFNCNTISRVEE